MKIPWRRKWQSTPVLLPGKHHGQRSLVGYSPWRRKESDTTERLHSLSVFWQFVQFSLLWSFLAVGGVVQVACQGFLVREACISVVVGGAGFLLSGVQ